MASLSTLASDIGTIATWFWGLFSDFIGIITSNTLILWPIILGLTLAAVYVVIRTIRKFGLKGKR